MDIASELLRIMGRVGRRSREREGEERSKRRGNIERQWDSFSVMVLMLTTSAIRPGQAECCWQL